jgi:DNA polymerase V
MRRLDEVIDRINRMHGSETIVIGAQQYTQKDGKGKAAIEREQGQAGTNDAEHRQARPKFKAEVFANAIKHDFKSPCATTRWSDIIKIK